MGDRAFQTGAILTAAVALDRGVHGQYSRETWVLCLAAVSAAGCGVAPDRERAVAAGRGVAPDCGRGGILTAVASG